MSIPSSSKGAAPPASPPLSASTEPSPRSRAPPASTEPPSRSGATLTSTEPPPRYRVPTSASTGATSGPPAVPPSSPYSPPAAASGPAYPGLTALTRSLADHHPNSSMEGQYQRSQDYIDTDQLEREPVSLD